VSRNLFVGLITGTSMDGIDAALVAVDDSGMPTLVQAHTASLPEELCVSLHHLASGQPVLLDDLCKADSWLGESLADAVNELLTLADISPSQVTAIGSHGQTLHHRPQGLYRSTLQVGDPNIIAERTGITTVADVRRRDMAAGGQGAPLLPTLHHQLLVHAEETRVILNLGGIANVTVLEPGASAASFGFDTGPANTLLDAWIRRHLDKPYDKNGDWAKSGKTNTALLAQCLAEPYFVLKPPKSTGRELFNIGWLDTQLANIALKPTPQDVQATMIKLVSRTVVDALAAADVAPDRIIVAGGGVHNETLMASLREQAEPVIVGSAADHGIDVDSLEAMAFACFAWAHLAQRASSPSQITGASRRVVLGAAYPGNV
jgi:anhydro-N-acetylmuramic acid kinase